MRIARVAVLTLFAAALSPTTAHAVPEGWHKSLKDGLEAAAKSGKPLLLVSAWADRI